MRNKISHWLSKKVELLCLYLEKSILLDPSLRCKIVYGPIRSRRLGLVIGVNNIKPNLCSYNCIYCPGGKTTCCSVCRSNCLSPYELFISVKKKLDEINKSGKKIDCILFAGSGEPALDTSLSQEIQLLREFDHKIAVFTNASLLWNENIQENLLYADYISVKIDTVNVNTWLKINRPHERLNYDLILNGIKQFSKKFKGTLTTATTFLKDINDNEEEVTQLAKFLNSIKIKTAYFLTPIYPPAEDYAISPEEETLKKLSQIITANINNSCKLCCPEQEEFFITNDFENELVGLLKVHPVDKDAVTAFANANNKIENLREMLSNNLIGEQIFSNKKYFVIAETK